jgi:hypothetical protein
VFTLFISCFFVQQRIFYEICAIRRQQHLLKQQLWQKQLQLEGSINPAAISERLGKEK